MPLPDLRDPLDLDVERVARCLRAASSVSGESRAAVGVFLSEVLPDDARAALDGHVATMPGSTLAAIISAVVHDARTPYALETNCRRSDLTDLEPALSRLRRALSSPR